MILAIPIWRYQKRKTWLWDMLSRAIVYFTGYPYTHVGIYFEGKLYESAVWLNSRNKLRSGIRITNIAEKGWPGEPPDIFMVPWRIQLTEDRIRRIRHALEHYVEMERPYNVLKLLMLIVVWPTRWFWKHLKWVPFNHDFFGEVCSGFVDEVMYKAQWDLFPEEWEGYTVPGQFIGIHGWRAEKCDDCMW